MTLLQMSFSGAVLILVIAVLRKGLFRVLPKRAFVALWCVALARLLIPVSLPAAFSAYSLLDRSAPVRTAIADTPAVYFVPTAPAPAVAADMSDAAAGGGPPAWIVLWAVGVAVCTLYFLWTYLRCVREFRMALPVENADAAAWLAAHPLRRRMMLRQSQAVDAPLTYGVLRPVILVPKGMDWDPAGPMDYVLRHEYEHIRHFDPALKLVAVAAVCLHWWNPAVWLLYVLLNRDLELACDACVVRAMGDKSRVPYARALIGMEECRSTAHPLSAAFNQTAIEERITAVMRARRTPVVCVVLAMAVVACVAAAFATTSVGALRSDLKEIPDGAFTSEESRRLFSLWFDGYEKMTVADYQEKIWNEFDAPEDRELLERFSLSEFTVQTDMTSPEERAFWAFYDYYVHICEPLTAERWESRTFGGTSTARGKGSGQEWAVLEYDITLEVLDAEHLTVGTYDKTRKRAMSELGRLWHGKTEAELRDAASLAVSLDEEIPTLAARLSTDKLSVSVDYGFVPLEGAPGGGMVFDAIEQEWDDVLAPYVPLGLVYTYAPDSTGNGLYMSYQGREVSGIMDEEAGLWITEHTGLSAYGPDAGELYVVYENGKRTGLRFATEEEQAVWTADRQKSTDASRTGADVPEERRYPHGTAADYASLLTLRTDGYSDLPLAVFNDALLAWCNANYGAMERTGTDAARDDWGVPLTEEEKAFVSGTVQLSRWENACAVDAARTGGAVRDPAVTDGSWVRDTGDGGWASLYAYTLSYHVSDPARVTVSERDRCVSGMRAAAYTFFWEECDMETLLSMTETEVYERLSALAAQYSTTDVTLSVARDGVHFESMDERASRHP